MQTPAAPFSPFLPSRSGALLARPATTQATPAAMEAEATYSSPAFAPVLRPVRPDDLPTVRRFVIGLSPQSRRLRFHGGLNPTSERLLRHLTMADGENHAAWVAVLPCDDGDVVVGEARWVRTGEGTAELAIAVADAWQGCGVARALLQRLLHSAGSAGVATLTADVLCDNGRMAAFLRREGFEAQHGDVAENAGGVSAWARTLRAPTGPRPGASG